MIELPKEKTNATRVNPKKIVIFSKPKVGKTTAIAGLDNLLIIDVERGSNFLSALKIDILEIAEKEEITPMQALKAVINKLKEANKQKGGYVYKYGAIDTVTALEELSIELANRMYKNTAIGKNWQGDDVTTLANGAGYYWSRKALSLIINELAECFDTFIILGHLKEKLIEKEGKEMTERGLDLTGKSASILCSQVDAIAYMYRDEDATVLNFAPSETTTCGSRSEHLKNKKIKVITSDKDGNLQVDWSEVFLKES